METNQDLYAHYETTLCINKIRLCAECPLKLYAKKNENIILGIGNIITDTIMILPSYDIKVKIGYPNMLQIITKLYSNIKGTSLFEDCYVTRSIKCLNKTDFNLEKDAIKSCITNLLYEVGRIMPKKIIIFDKQLYDFDLYVNSVGTFDIKTCISPAVMYYDNQKLKDIFIKQFSEAI